MLYNGYMPISIGIVFYTKNYKAAGHTDDDRSKWAIGILDMFMMKE